MDRKTAKRAMLVKINCINFMQLVVLNFYLRWLAPVSSRGAHVTRASRAKDKLSKQIWRRAAFFMLGYFCPVLNETVSTSTTFINSLCPR